MALDTADWSDGKRPIARIPSVLGLHLRAVPHPFLYRQYRQMLLVVLVQNVVQIREEEPFHWGLL